MDARAPCRSAPKQHCCLPSHLKTARNADINLSGDAESCAITDKEPAELSSALRPMSLQAPEPPSLEVSDGPAPLRPPPEADFVQAGKLSMGQLAQAHRDRLETGKQVLDIIVERGWVTAEEVAELRAAHGIEAPAEPVQTAPESPPESEAPPQAAA